MQIVINRTPFSRQLQQARKPSLVLSGLSKRSYSTSLKVFASYAPPALAETKSKFTELYPKPISAVYNTVLQELLAQAHFQCFNKNFQYDEIYGLGLTSALDQILEGLEGGNQEQIFEAFTQSVGLNPSKIREDQKAMEAWASQADGWEYVVPKDDGNEGQQKLMGIVARIKEGNFTYTKFFAVGIFRLLELSGAKDTKALEEVVKALGVDQVKVNKDLTIYRNILSKMSAAKELLKEMLERERKKQAEREAAKAEQDGGQSPQGEDKATTESTEEKTEVQA